MRFSILIALLTTQCVVFCKDQYLHQRRYKDNKSKRGIGDYSGVSYDGSSFQSFQGLQPHSLGVSFPPSFSGFGGYDGVNPLGHSSFNLSPQSAASFSTIGTPSLTTHNSGQSLNIDQNSPYNLQSSGLNFAGLLNPPVNEQLSYLSPTSGLYSQLEKTGPVTFTSQESMTTPSQTQYAPVYATGSQLESKNYAIPVILGSSQASPVQGYRISPSTLNNLNPQSFSINSIPASNGGSYSTSYSTLTEDSSPHIVSGSYIMAPSSPQKTISPSSYSLPISRLTSSPSSDYTISIPVSSYASMSSNPSYSNSSPSTRYQLPIAASSISGDFRKFAIAPSNDNLYSINNPMRAHDMTLKLENLANPRTLYRSSSNSNSGYPNSVDTNFVIAPNYVNNNLRAIPARQSNYLVTSYGTPAMSYAIPSMNYGTPSNTQSVSNSNSNSQNTVSMSPSFTYTSSDISNYSNAANSYSTPTSSSTYQIDSSYKNSGRTSPSINYSRPDTSYGAFSSSFSNNENSILNYKSSSSKPTSSSLKSIENYSSSPSSNMYDNGSDSSALYSNLSTRYFRYPTTRSLPYTENSESAISSAYDTISYSVPSRKY